MSDEYLNPNYWSIKQLFEKQFSVPVYQRPYSWQHEQIQSLLDDIWGAYEEYNNLDEDGQQKFSLYVGNIFLHRKSQDLYDVIDGQQRITTISIILLSIYAILSEQKCDKNNRMFQNIESALWKHNNNEEPIKSKKVIELGNLDKQFMSRLFDEAFDMPSGLRDSVNHWTALSVSEKNIKTNFTSVYYFINSKFKSDEMYRQNVLSFGNFILRRVSVIAIINEDSALKAFSIFESINSKGKQLEDIDLIKTRIFSKLNPSDYSSYLNKWGDLITKTKDSLYDYFKVYIKANIKYYRNDISFKKFQGMDDLFCAYFKTKNISDAYKVLIDDMLNEVDNFILLRDAKMTCNIIKDSRFKYYYTLYARIRYEHPWALFFRCFCEYNKGKLSRDNLITIIIDTIKFCASTLTVVGKESKTIINVLSAIFDGIYNTKIISVDWVIHNLKKELTAFGIDESQLIYHLELLDLFSYDKSKYFGAAVLSAYESQYFSNGEKVSWDEAYSKFSTYGESYSLDHLMVQTPDISDNNLKYYKLGNNLKLKQGHDFPDSLVQDGMDYDEFKEKILHVAGNLRLKGHDGNSSRGNESEETFNTYKKLTKRNKQVCKFFVEHVLLIKEEVKNINEKAYTSSSRKNSKMTGNFDMSMSNLDLTGVKPRTVSIKNTVYNIHKLNEILLCIVEYLYQKEPAKIRLLASNDWKPRRRIMISNSQESLLRGIPINGLPSNEPMIFVETNLSARDIIFYVQLLLDMFNIPRESVSVYIPE